MIFTCVGIDPPAKKYEGVKCPWSPPRVLSPGERTGTPNLSNRHPSDPPDSADETEQAEKQPSKKVKRKRVSKDGNGDGDGNGNGDVNGDDDVNGDGVGDY